MSTQEFLNELKTVKAKSLMELSIKIAKINPFSEKFGIVFRLKIEDGWFSLESGYRCGYNWEELNLGINHFFVNKKTEDLVLIQNFSDSFRVNVNFNKSWHIFNVKENKPVTLSFFEETGSEDNVRYLKDSFGSALKDHFQGKKKTLPIAS